MRLLLMCIIFVGFIGCKDTTSKTEAPKTETPKTETTEIDPPDDGGSQDHPDLVEINDVIHQFYTWYESNAERIAKINYIKSGKPATLDNAKLDAYHAQLLTSGSLSQVYIDGDRAYLKNLEGTAWKNENVEEEPLTGLDFDKFYCAQDSDINFWKTAPVTADGLGTAKSTAIMSGMEGGSPREQQFEMLKENGKWKIAKIVCKE